ncbi:MAG: hypothetical protein IJS81_02555, partial [Selenomonadaceae bacterium]|nr:hypothetical protein [Selenomonadaceae bacterium]
MRIKNLKLNSDDQVITKIVGEVLRAFHIEVGNFDAADYDEFQIINDIRGDKVTTRLVADKKIFQHTDFINPAERRGAEIHRLIKKNLYLILTQNFNLRGVPYGIMHGVRPTKIIHRWLRNNFAVTSHGVID